MNLDELRTVQSKERRKDSLQHLRDSFYGDVAGYIADLKAERSAAAEEADDPFSSPEVSRLTDEIETAEEVIEAVYERRVGKVVKLASFAAAEMPVDEDGMTAEEKALFEDLVARIEENKENVLAILAGKREPVDTGGESMSTAATDMVGPDGSRGESSTPVPQTEPADSADSAAGGVLADAMGGDTTDAEADAQQSPEADNGSTDDHTPVDPEPAPPGAVSEPSDESTDASADAPAAPDATEAAADDTERTTVRITKDVGSIFGVDEREYDLATDDVVMLPTTNAEPLIEREAAEKLD